jgi:hypothetical protein
MAGKLRDLMQSASNTVASNVSGPVDLIGMLLRYGGIPVPQDAVGGSQWMEQKGLTKPVQQSGTSLAGETIGMLAPIGAAAKAPQIAAGLLKQGDQFQRYNQALGPSGASQAIVWHGSPHKFAAFDSSKIGTGEGAQAYGHGLYLADAKGVGNRYAQELAKNRPITGASGQAYWKSFSPGADDSLNNAISLLKDGYYKDPQEGLQAVKAMLQSETNAGSIARLKSMEKAWSRLADDSAMAAQPYLYKVDLPDEKIARMLDWDKPLSQQAPEVQKALMEARGGKPFENTAEAIFQNYVKNAPESMRSSEALQAVWRDAAERQAYEVTGQSAYKQTAGHQGQYVDKLRQAGIPGIRYLDGGSRGAGVGSSNYVVFPGEESALQILERNGQPLQRLSNLVKK